MKRNEKGFTIVEMVVAVSLAAMLALAATAFTFHALRTSAKTQDSLVALSSVQNAGYWVSHDANMADDVITTDLTAPAIMVIKWTDWGYGEDNIYYSATYSVDDVTAGVGKLNRRLQSSDGLDQRTLVADNIYYDLSDPANSTNVTYQNQTIEFRVAAHSGSGVEVRNYEISQRPSF